jgi:hypothetical protein
MLQIINQRGITLQPDSNTVVAIEVYNPLFTDNKDIFQELVYTAQAGLTETNIAFIENGHLVDASIDVFEQKVTVLHRGIPFYAGTFRHRIMNGKINFDLKVNFGTVASKMKNTNIRDIITLDSVFVEGNYPTNAQMTDHMKDTCVHPENYPYAFFPVKNTKWTDDSANVITYPWMNYWDHAAQKFTIVGSGTMDPRNTLQVPFYKLSYILTKIFEYLNFTLEGEILTDVDFNAIYLYTRRPLLGNLIMPCMTYLPAELKISDFITQISERLKLNFTYNVLNNSVSIDSPISSLKVNQIEDITPYIENIEELSVSDKKGYKVILKVDESDFLFDVSKNDEDRRFVAPFTLVVGDGQTEIEMEVGTLKEVKEADYSYPATEQATDLIGVPGDVNWQIRLLTFYGMKSVSGGKVFPQAAPMDLGEADSNWYRFLNDSKKIVATAKLPSSILSRFSPTTKYGFKSKQGTFTRTLNGKYSFGLTGVNSELTTVKIESYTLVDEYSTKFSIQPFVPDNDPASPILTVTYKFCYLDGSQPDESFLVTAVPKSGSPATFISTPAAAPADAGGVGGQIGYIRATSGTRTQINGYSLKIDRKPLYVIASGIKRYFTAEGDHFVSPEFSSGDGRPMLFVF